MSQCDHEWENGRDGWVCRKCGEVLKYWLER